MKECSFKWPWRRNLKWRWENKRGSVVLVLGVREMTSLGPAHTWHNIVLITDIISHWKKKAKPPFVTIFSSSSNVTVTHTTHPSAFCQQDWKARTRYSKPCNIPSIPWSLIKHVQRNGADVIQSPPHPPIRSPTSSPTHLHVPSHLHPC